MDSKIWIVQGTTGEYSDHMQWMVAAYTDKTLAEAHAEAALQWVVDQEKAAGVEQRRERPGARSHKGEHLDWDEMYRNNIKNPYDADMSIDYTGVMYFIEEVELRTSLPT